MKRIGTLVLAVILVTGCNAMKPNIEETELFSKEIEKRIYARTLPANAPEPVEAAAESTEAAPAPAPIIVSDQEDELRPVPSEPAATTKPTEKSQPKNPVLIEKPIEIEPEPAPQPDKSTQKSANHLEQVTPQQTGQTKENPMMIEWPYPAITCPPESTPAPQSDWPYITAPVPPIYTPEPEPVEPPQEEPMPTPQPTPAVSADPVAPAPEPTEQPTEPMPAPPAEQPSGGYAECSCGAKLTPEEVLPHMKAHAFNGESHSYRAY